MTTNQKLILIVVLIFAAAMSGCTEKSSTYIHDSNPDEYMELYIDQRYVVVQDAGFCGTWYLHDNALHLYFNDALLYVLQPNGTGYLDPDGDRWTKK